MSDPLAQIDRFIIYPLTAERWDDFQRLFGERGACSGCWCMWWRLKRADWQAQAGEGNRRAMQAIVASGQIPGLLAYVGDESVGWCSVAPREDFPVLGRSSVLKPVDEKPVWSVVCFFVHREWRGRGMTGALLQAAARIARQHGATILEGYPVEPQPGQPVPATSAFVGVSSVFVRAGFVEVARRKPRRPIMRLDLTRSVMFEGERRSQ